MTEFGTKNGTQYIHSNHFIMENIIKFIFQGIVGQRILQIFGINRFPLIYIIYFGIFKSLNFGILESLNP